MDIIFSDRKFEKECNDKRLMQRRHGAGRSKLLKRRLVQLRAAPTLGIFHPPYSKPARCHQLTNRENEFSVDLDHPYRLIFRPAHNPVPLRDEGGIDWFQIVVVEILGVEDTHE